MVETAVMFLGLLVLVYLLVKQYETITKSHTEIVDKLCQSVLESVATMQLEQGKYSFQVMKLLTPKIVDKPVDNFINETVKNDIEDKDAPEIQLDENMKIPIVDGMKVQFEDEEEILPINIVN